MAMIHFDNWRRRIKDHFISVNCNSAKVFELAESSKVPIKWEWLPTTTVPELPYVNWSWIATQIWTFTGAYLTLLRRTSLTLGQEFIGLELWRAPCMENCKGSAEMVNTERSFFIGNSSPAADPDLYSYCVKVEARTNHNSLCF